MHPVGADGLRKVRVRRDQKREAAALGEARGFFGGRKVWPAKMAIDQARALRQAPSEADEIGRARGVGQRPQHGEARTSVHAGDTLRGSLQSDERAISSVMAHLDAPAPVSPDVSARRNGVLSAIANAAKAAGRSRDDVTLVAVSKQQPDERIDVALAAGQRVFGENRVQEAQARWGERRTAYPDLELRLVGPLQSNKAEAAVALFDVIETLDREKLAKALTAAMEKVGRRPRLYVQVNTGEEHQKAGVAPRETEAFVARVREAYGLSVEGLMCIPPVDEEPALHFALLADLAARCGVEKLSMGMSADFETAVRFGATSVRVGSGVFGPRPSSA